MYAGMLMYYTLYGSVCFAVTEKIMYTYFCVKCCPLCSIPGQILVQTVQYCFISSDFGTKLSRLTGGIVDLPPAIGLRKREEVFTL